MNALLDHANTVSDEVFGPLTTATASEDAPVAAPVLATTAIALGIAVGAAAFHAGYMVGIARNMAEGTRPVPK